ncbi:MAG: chromosome segregation protein SMC [Oscillospiraceae bacterium]|nr:chromosome segregation protein SMC [Oscillospiraceae bacterium]
MRLASLEIQGFKSFPDKTRLEFGEGITAVVGPNGSGKSNIADAVRWALGEQSSKTLRGGRMDDVIFGGTQNRKSVGYASVALTIDNSDGMLADYDSEITVSRRLYRSGESEYRIGASMVRLRDIHELFMDTGLGRDGYSIIGQGKIAEIVSAKSGQRREIFEEAAGIAKFRYRREEAERRLAQAQDNLLRINDILLELEGRVEPLRIQSEKAKEFLALSEERRSLEVSLWMLALTELRSRLSEQENKILVSKNDYEQLETDSERLELQIAGTYRDMQELSAHMDVKRNDIRNLDEHKARCETRIAVSQSDIGHNEQNATRLRGELAGFDLNSREVEELLAAKQEEYNHAKDELERMHSRMEAAKQNLDEQRMQVEKLDAEILGLENRKAVVEGTAADLRLEQAASSSLMAESKSRLETLRGGVLAHDAAVAEVGESIAECALMLERESERVAGLANARQGYELKRESREKRLRELRDEHSALLGNAAQRQARAKLLEDLEANMEGYPGSVKHILSESRKGALSGVFGAVSSLISTKQEHITAIETAFGAAMQNIVVQDENTAKRAMRMLQSAGAGRATFLPVSSYSGKAMDASGIKKHPAFIGVASELVDCDPKFSGVIGRLLGRVAIVADLDSATVIARENRFAFRIVTLDGQVIHSGGSFTGGSTVKTAGVLGRKNEIERLRSRAAEFSAQAEGLEPKLRAAAQELSALDAALSGTVGELQSAQEEKVRLELLGSQLGRNLEAAQENRGNARAELAALTQRLEQIGRGEADMGKLQEELSVQLAELEAQIASVRGRKMHLAAGTETASQALSEQSMAHLAAGKDADTLAAEIGRLQDQIENAGMRSEQITAELAQVLSQNEETARLIAGLREEIEGLSGKADEFGREIAALAEQRIGLEAETTKLRQEERGLSSRREDVSRELARLEERRASMQVEYDNIIKSLWDEYELTRSQAAQQAQPVADRPKAQRRLTELRGRIRGLGSVNVEAVEEYREVYERYTFLTAQVKDVTEARERLLELIGQLTEEMRTLFRDNFVKIAAQFSRVFRQLFGGGHGELTLTGDGDVLEAGIEINVQPPGKVIKNLTLLSGGEQALVAICIYFSILKVKPAPFCLIDEIEAALDDVNVTRFAAYLRQMCSDTQFIAITHRRGTMEEADTLYGVTMQEEGVSKLLELRLNEIERLIS